MFHKIQPNYSIIPLLTIAIGNNLMFQFQKDNHLWVRVKIRNGEMK